MASLFSFSAVASRSFLVLPKLRRPPSLLLAPRLLFSLRRLSSSASSARSSFAHYMVMSASPTFGLVLDRTYVLELLEGDSGISASRKTPDALSYLGNALRDNALALLASRGVKRLKSRRVWEPKWNDCRHRGSGRQVTCVFLLAVIAGEASMDDDRETKELEREVPGFI